MKKILILLALNTNQLIYAQTALELKNIETFNRVYGYVRYFHPSDEAATLDWNTFASYGSKKVENCKNSTELHRTLMDLFQPIAPTMQIIKSSDKHLLPVKILTPPDTIDYSVISWQHLGIGLADANSAYKSSRLNRATSVQHSFSTVTCLNRCF